MSPDHDFSWKNIYLISLDSFIPTFILPLFTFLCTSLACDCVIAPLLLHSVTLPTSHSHSRDSCHSVLCHWAYHIFLPNSIELCLACSFCMAFCTFAVCDFSTLASLFNLLSHLRCSDLRKLATNCVTLHANRCIDSA